MADTRGGACEMQEAEPRVTVRPPVVPLRESRGWREDHLDAVNVDDTATVDVRRDGVRGAGVSKELEEILADGAVKREVPRHSLSL